MATSRAAADPRLRVAVLSTGLSTGGAEMMLLKLAEALQPRLDLTVYSLRDAGTIGPRIAALGVPVVALGLQSPVGWPRAWRMLARLPVAQRPAVLVGWMYHGNLLATMLQRWWGGTPGLVWNIRQSLTDLTVERPRTRLLIRRGAAWAGRADVVVYNSHVAMAQHQAQGYAGRRSLVIPNGFDLARYRPDPEARARVRGALGVPAEAPLLGLVARYHPMKDHPTFLHAAARVLARHPEAWFACLGRGVDETNAALRALRSALGLEGRLLLLGEREDVPAHLAALDLLCSSSSSGEGFPNVLGEAMACGVPCVATDVGDSGRVVDAFGAVVAPGDPEALAAACLRVLGMEPAERARLGAAARASIASRYSLAAVAGEYEAAIRSAARAPDQVLS